MTPSDLHSLASAVYGARWQSQLARDMNIALRTVQRWAVDGIGKSRTAETVRRFLEERRIARIAAPPAGTTDADDRDHAAYEALHPGVRALVSAAVDMGWSAPEAMIAIFNTVVDVMVAAAGSAATIETLRATIDSIKAARDT